VQGIYVRCVDGFIWPKCGCIKFYATMSAASALFLPQVGSSNTSTVGNVMEKTHTRPEKIVLGNLSGG
jgi:hypothetical protein